MCKQIKVGLGWVVAPIVMAVSAMAADVTPKPNILLIVADDLGYGDVGCYGSTQIPTPHLDRLASEGVRATDAHASAAVCTPSRFGMLTGRYYTRYPQNWVGELLIERDRPTIASILRQHGYATGYFGKWHLGWGEHDDREQRAAIDWNAELPAGVLECGFDTYFGTPFSHNEAPFVFVKDRRVVGLEAEDPLMIPPQSEDKGPWGWGNSKGARKAHEMRPRDQIDPIVTRHACEWIEQHAQRPFFMNVALVAPHVPIAPSRAFVGKTAIKGYGDFVYQMDACVGELLKTLDTCGLADRTLVIFTSDNGAVIHTQVWAAGQQSNGEWLGQKTDAWEGGCRVPFLARLPGRIPAGSVCRQLISLTDMMRTVCAAADVPVPEGAGEDSIDQWPVLTRPDQASPARTEMALQGIYGSALRSGDWLFLPKQGSQGVTTTTEIPWPTRMKEIGLPHSDYDDKGELRADAPAGQLYHLGKDPRQRNNIYHREPERVRSMAERLKVLTRKTPL